MRCIQFDVYSILPGSARPAHRTGVRWPLSLFLALRIRRSVRNFPTFRMDECQYLSSEIVDQIPES